jgi:protein subunit release factor B
MARSSHGERELQRLLSECRVTFYRASGPGGQHRNKTETAVRLHHLPSGITVTCADTRSQHRNRVLALARLRERLRARARRPKPRRPTKVPAGVRSRNLDAKKRQGTKKTLRRKPKTEQE